MEAFLPQPPHIPLLLRLGIWFSERVTGRVMLPARLLAWYPKAAVGSGVLESLVAHDEPGMDRRMLQLIRMAASHAAACPFCVDMNSHEHRLHGISDEEAEAVRGAVALETVSTLGSRERLAIQYARLVSQTPLKFQPEIVAQVRAEFNEREFVILATTAAQVNYWARLIQALGIPPAGFGDE
jgi:AhpD family alkylhydroperoxidase